MNLDPKSQFLSKKERAERHRALVDNAEFREFLLDAFAAYSFGLPGSDNPAHGWNSNCRRQGAKDFIETFLNLSTVPKPQKRTTSGELEPELN